MPPFTPNLYKDLAPYYDAAHMNRDYKGQVDFLVRIISDGMPPEAKVVELFCGTGGHAIPLAQKGFFVTGIDNAPHMLELAQQKVSAGDVNVQFLLEDCFQLSIQETFDVVFSFGQSFHYVDSHQSLRSLFSSIAEILRPGGLLIFDLINAWVLLDPYNAEHLTVEADGTRILRIERTTVNQDKRVKQSDMTWLIQRPDGTMFLERTTEQYRLFFLDELQFVLEICNLELQQVYNDYQTEKQSAVDTLVQIIVARKKE